MESSKSTSSSSLADLIARAQEQDEHAMTELIRTHEQRLLTSIRAELGDRVRQRLESQDVMQQVYLDALDHISRFEDAGGDSFFRWLRRIAVNRICDVDRRAFRTAKRGPEVRSADLGPIGEDTVACLFDQVGGSVTSPSVNARHSEQLHRLRRAVAGLNDDQREAIQLRYFSQLSVEETAEKMNRSERAVRSLCVRAIINLRESLEDAI